MSERPTQIFISYARADDQPPPDLPNEKGFVSYLYAQLKYSFGDAGPESPVIWRDTERIREADQFGQEIKQALRDSSILVVILSRHWMNSNFCRQELDFFVNYWRKFTDNVRERIVVVAKRSVDRDRRPSMLQGQMGYDFYTRDEAGDLGEYELFFRGKPRSDAYWAKYEKLCSFLLRRSKAIQRNEKEEPEVHDQIKAPGIARTIYVAKPAMDMGAAYDRVVGELRNEGYEVVPAPEYPVPMDPSAVHYFDEALARSEASIHFLGEKEGGKPDEDFDPIVQLQLARAAARAQRSRKDPREAKPTFRRIIWAPRVLRIESDQGGSTLERDPIAVLNRFDHQLPTDTVAGDDPGNFIIHLMETLKGSDNDERVAQENIARDTQAIGFISTEVNEHKSRIYVCHSKDDRKFALNVAKTLPNVEPVLPATEGDPGELRAHHRRNLRECDLVVLCWGAGSEVSIKAQSRELRNWQEVGRSRKWLLRSLVLGPPPGEVKAELKEVPPRSEIDLVVDLTQGVAPELLSQVVPRIHTAGL